MPVEIAPIEIVAGFLGASLLLYCLLGGADYGAGILELFRGRKLREEQKELIGHAIGPVWEANHMWLVLAVVILFNGFPAVYSTLATRFHIPLTMMLMGVILRGCAFTFRKYDAVRDRAQIHYDRAFAFASVLAPLMLGVVAGAMLLGRVPSPESGFVGTYVSPWLNFFSFSVGLLACVLFAFLAAVYLVGEAGTAELAKLFSARARAMNLAAIFCGALVFLSAHLDGMKLVGAFASEPMSLGCMALATLILIPLWICLNQRRVWATRILAATQVSLILGGWIALQFPAFLGVAQEGKTASLTIFNAAAPDSTLRLLIVALCAGAAIVFPALFFLLGVFKGQRAQVR